MARNRLPHRGLGSRRGQKRVRACLSQRRLELRRGHRVDGDADGAAGDAERRHRRLGAQPGEHRDAVTAPEATLVQEPADRVELLRQRSGRERGSIRGEDRRRIRIGLRPSLQNGVDRAARDRFERGLGTAGAWPLLRVMGSSLTSN